MARATTAAKIAAANPGAEKPAPKASTSTALVDWEKQMEAQAVIAAEAEANTGGGQFFSFKSATLSFNDKQLPNNEAAVIIAASVFENVFYEGEYDPDRAAPPTCFAHAEREEDLAPHSTVVDAGQAQHPKCAGCPMNAWGTADKGKGKACKNVRRLALLGAGYFRDGRFVPAELSDIEKGAFGYAKLPVMSVKGYGSFVKSVAGSMKLPPHGIVSRLKVVPDTRSQLRVEFEPIAKIKEISPDWIPAVMRRNEEARATIGFPYPLSFDDAEAAPAKGARGAKGAAAPVNRRPEVKKRKY